MYDEVLLNQPPHPSICTNGFDRFLVRLQFIVERCMVLTAINSMLLLSPVLECDVWGLV